MINRLNNYNVKLSKRLAQIENMVSGQYHHIWDCCCDHGLLGASLISSHPSTNIHFVDIVPTLINELEQKLKRFYSNALWHTHCLDVTNIPLTKFNGKHLVIIAGVGGDLIMQFVNAIHQQYKHLQIDFLFCPVHHQFALRNQLIELDFSLLDEALIEENKRFYEVLFVSSTNNGNCKIHHVGEKIWQSTSPQQTTSIQAYLTKTIKHYQRIQQGNTLNVQHIIDAYQNVKISNNQTT